MLRNTRNKKRALKRLLILLVLYFCYQFYDEDFREGLFDSTKTCSYDSPPEKSALNLLSMNIYLFLFFFIPSLLFGFEDFTNKIDFRVLSFQEIEARLLNESIFLVEGGKSLTKVNHECRTTRRSLKSIAFIVPYRNRSDNMKIFLNNMHEFWTRQKLNYGVYLIEPAESIEGKALMFNQAILNNIGFLEARIDADFISRDLESKRRLSWDCFIFHDVDMYNI
jgi:hypothetical protein